MEFDDDMSDEFSGERKKKFFKRKMPEGALVYDIETDSKDPKKANLKWFGAYSYRFNKMYRFTFNQKEEITNLMYDHRVLIGFNNRNFDNQVLEREIPELDLTYKSIIDLWEVSKKRLGNMGKAPPDYKLKTIVDMLGLDKSGKGEIDYDIFKKDEWTNEEIKIIKEYLDQDIIITRALFDWFKSQFEPLKKYMTEKDGKKFAYVSTSTASLAYRVICEMSGLEPTFKSDEAEETEDRVQEDDEETEDKEKPKKKGRVKIAGGHHIYPREDRAKGHIISIDYTSAYPHAIMSGNLLSPKEGGWSGEHAKTGNQYYQIGGQYETDKMGKMEESLRTIFHERLKAKKDGDKVKNISYKIVINCFSEDTEVLTIDGLKPLKECKAGELVYSINQKTEEVEIKPITHMYEQEYKGDMIHFKDRNKDLMVTPNHDMLVKPANNPRRSIRKIQAENVNTGRYPNSKPIEGRNILIDMKQFSHDFFSSFKNNSYGLPDWVWDYDYRVLKYLHDGLYDGDGNKGRYRYTTASKKLRDDMIKLNLHLGYRCYYKQEEHNGKKYWRIYRTHSGKYLKSSKHVVTNPTDKIICCSVADNSTIMAGRNGNLQWTGQSFYGTLGNNVFTQTYDPVAGGDCTSMVRNWMKRLAYKLEMNGYHVLYGFTDSVMCLLPEHNTKEDLMVVVDEYVKEVNESVPFPQETFGLEIDKEMKFFWVVTTNCYLWVNMDDTVGYRSTLLNKNTPEIIMQLFDDYMAPKIVKELDVKFTEQELRDKLKEFLKKDLRKAGQEYTVNEHHTYKSKTSMQYNISKTYGEGKHLLIPNLKLIGIGRAKGTKRKVGVRYCTIKEFEDNKLTIDDIDLNRLMKYIQDFYEGTEGEDPAQQRLFGG